MVTKHMKYIEIVCKLDENTAFEIIFMEINC